jgi:putative endonuclease
MRFNLLRRPKTATAKQELGARGEKAAAKYLRRHGYKVLLRGFRSRSGEIDIVCRHKDWLVFVEVKTRESEQFGAPSEAVDERKQRHITKVALDYLRLLDNPPIKFRFDIVEVLMRNDARKPNEVSLIQNAFDLSEPYIY